LRRIRATSFITPKEGWEDPPRYLSPTQSLQTPSAFCGQCGKHIPAGLKFCTGCGAAVSVAPQVPAVVYQPPYHNQQPYSPFNGVPQPPQLNQQIVIVQQPTSTGVSGWAIFFVLLFFPLWPITIPILIIVALVKAFSD